MKINEPTDTCSIQPTFGRYRELMEALLKLPKGKFLTVEFDNVSEARNAANAVCTMMRQKHGILISRRATARGNVYSFCHKEGKK